MATGTKKLSAEITNEAELETRVSRYLTVKRQVEALEAAVNGTLSNPIQGPVTIKGRQIDINSLNRAGVQQVAFDYIESVNTMKTFNALFERNEELMFSGYTSTQVFDALKHRLNVLDAAKVLPKYKEVKAALYAAMTSEEKREVSSQEALSLLNGLEGSIAGLLV